MSQIIEPVKSWNIIFRYYTWEPGHSSKGWHEDKFKTITKLKDYFTVNPAAGYLVGYGKNTHGWTFAFEAELQFEWTDGANVYVLKQFPDVFAFAAFLDEHPAIAKCVEYVKKEK